MEDREPTVRARHLGRVLAEAMQAKGVTSRQIAAELGFSQSKISRVLTGKRGMSPVDLAALLALCGITGAGRDRLLILAAEATKSSWCEEHGECVPVDLPVLRDLEDTAISVTCVDTVAVPALVQTEDYRRALLHASPVISDEEITDRITHHRTRQQLLDRNNPPTVRLFLAEHVLTHAGVDRDVMCDQVHHLLRLAVQPHVEIRLIPARCPVIGVCSPFQLMTFSELRPVVYLEHLTSTAFLDQPATIASYERVRAEMDGVALDPELSRSKLATIAVSLSEPVDPPDAACDGWLGQLLAGRVEGAM